MMVSNGNLRFQWVIFRCHVSFREGTSQTSTAATSQDWNRGAVSQGTEGLRTVGEVFLGDFRGLKISRDTVDGSEIPFPTTEVDVQNPVNNGINYQPQLLQDF